MKQKSGNRIFATLICTVLMVLILPVSVNADTGPKRSVQIMFANMGDELCYGTLLSKNDSTGPSLVWDGDEETAAYDADDPEYDAWKAFVEYEDADGYYFLQEVWNVSDSKEIVWGYYPPESFKILLYYPETGSYAVSDIYKQYAFDTYYTVDMEGISAGTADSEESDSDISIEACRSYNYCDEIWSLIARIIITIIIEMLVALLFGFRKKKQLLLLIVVNAATQIILNVLLNLINYNSGEHAFVAFYVLFELIVFAIEAVVYCRLMNRWTGKPRKKWFYIVYAFAANAVSFAAGIVIAQILPEIF